MAFAHAWRPSADDVFLHAVAPGGANDYRLRLVGHAVPRLKRRADFLYVARRGRKWATPGMVLQAAPAVDRVRDAARVGFTATRKIGPAVVRNRARRRLRALADEILPRYARVDLDYVMIARAATVSRPRAALAADFLAALAKVGGLAAMARPGDPNDPERRAKAGDRKRTETKKS